MCLVSSVSAIPRPGAPGRGIAADGIVAAVTTYRWSGAEGDEAGGFGSGDAEHA